MIIAAAEAVTATAAPLTRVTTASVAAFYDVLRMTWGAVDFALTVRS